MKNRLTVTCAQTKNDHLHLVVNDSIVNLTPAEHMLVDSDQFSFIYLMENMDKDYTYIIVPEQVWPDLKEAMEENHPVLLTFKEEQIELINFQSELNYLIDNIKGNGNYGDEMVGKVENMF